MVEQWRPVNVDRVVECSAFSLVMISEGLRPFVSFSCKIFDITI